MYLLPDSLHPSSNTKLSAKDFERIVTYFYRENRDSGFIARADSFVMHCWRSAMHLEDKASKVAFAKTAISYLHNSNIFVDTLRSELLNRLSDTALQIIGDASRFEKEHAYIASLKAFWLFYNMSSHPKDYEQAADLLSDSWNTYLSLKDSSGLTQVANFMGILYHSMDMNKESALWTRTMNAYNPATDIDNKIAGEIVLFTEYAELYDIDTLQIGYIDSLDQIINFVEANYEPKYQYSLLYLKAVGQLVHKQYEDARIYIDSAWALRADPKMNLKLVRPNLLIYTKAKIYEKTASKKQYLDILHMIAADKQLGINSYSIFQTLNEDAIARKDWRAAFFYYKQFKEFEEKRNIKASRAKVFEVNQKYRVKEKEATIGLLQTENQYNRSKFRLFLVIAALVLLLLTAAFILVIRNRRLKQLKKDMAHKAAMDKLQDILLKQEEALKEKLQAEREAIGRNLHDSISGTLASLKYLASDFKDQEKASGLANNWDIMLEEIDHVYNETRSYSHQLVNKTAESEHFKLSDYLSQIKSKFNWLGSLEIHVDPSGEIWEALTSQQSMALYYIIKELLTNTIKHAGANNVWIDLALQNQSYQFIYGDDGKVSSKHLTSSGIGMQSIEQNVHHLNGDLSIDSRAGLRYLIIFPA